MNEDVFHIFKHIRTWDKMQNTYWMIWCTKFFYYTSFFYEIKKIYVSRCIQNTLVHFFLRGRNRPEKNKNKLLQINGFLFLFIFSAGLRGGATNKNFSRTSGNRHQIFYSSSSMPETRSKCFCSWRYTDQFQDCRYWHQLPSGEFLTYWDNWDMAEPLAIKHNNYNISMLLAWCILKNYERIFHLLRLN